MKIAVAKEIDPSEPRVAASPDTVKKFKALGVDIAVEPGAGVKSGLPDSEFTAAGATVSADAVKDADIVIKVKRPEASELANYKRGALVIAIMDPYGNDAALKAMADAGIIGFRDGIDAAHHPRPGRWTCCRARPISPAIAR